MRKIYIEEKKTIQMCAFIYMWCVSVTVKIIIECLLVLLQNKQLYDLAKAVCYFVRDICIELLCTLFVILL